LTFFRAGPAGVPVLVEATVEVDRDRDDPVLGAAPACVLLRGAVVLWWPATVVGTWLKPVAPVLRWPGTVP